MVDKNQFNNLKNKIDTPQIHLPQIQIAIGTNDFTTAEIWFEHDVLRKWTEHLSNKLLSGKFNNLDAGYYLWSDKEDDWTLKGFNGKSKVINEFVKQINNNSNLKGGISYVYDKSGTPLNKNIFNLIKNDLQKIIKDYYIPIIGYSKFSSKVKNVPKLRNRKEAKKITIKKIFRKGTQGGEVNQLHKKMQKKYINYLISIYGYKNVKPEKDFIDITVKDKNKLNLYEIKTDISAYKCIRQALGQLLFYAWRIKNTDKNKKIKLYVVGLNKLENNIQEFYDFVKNSIHLDIEYIKYPFKI